MTANRLCIFILLYASICIAQIPDRFENLQVLPKDTSKKELVNLMKGFTRSLGQSCEYCHVGKGRDLNTFNFASDEKLAKKTAREMMQMTHAINQQYLSKITSSSAQRVNVTCATCHHGQARPEAIEDIIRTTLNESGITAAIQKYRDLREQYYGSYSYDFDEGPLNRLALELSEKEQISQGISLLKLNTEFHPRSARLESLLGDLLLKSGAKEEALIHYNKSLELEPENDAVKKTIQELNLQQPKQN
jgi:tetratricopeptide (TPR) repeat protein